jgi:hypothetical protein
VRLADGPTTRDIPVVVLTSSLRSAEGRRTLKRRLLDIQELARSTHRTKTGRIASAP